MNTYSLRHIIFPTDFSEVAENALDTAIAMCQRHMTRLTIVHVIEQHYLLVSAEASFMSVDVLSQLQKNAEDLLAGLLGKIKYDGQFEISTVVRIGNAADEIRRLSRETRADLIVMGTHGASGLREFFIGSNAYRVVKHTPCGVLTIPGQTRWLNFRRILFPIRIVAGALSKYDFIRPIIRGNGSSLLLAGIVEKHGPYALEEMKSIVETAAQKMKEDDVICRAELHNSDDIAKHVIHLSEAEKPDLIVIMASLEKYSKGLFVGPYSQHIVNHSKFPVLSIRPDITPESALS